MFSQQKGKIVIIIAPTGSTRSREGGPYVPMTPREIAEDVFACYQAGAAIAHIHAIDEKTKLVTADIKVFGEIFTRIREKCDMLIQSTGGIGSWLDPVTNKRFRASDEQRMAFLDIDPKPDMYPVPIGSVDVVYPVDGRMTPSDGSYATLFNTPDFLRKIIPALVEKKIGWEWEVFDVSFLYNGLRLAEEGVFDKNMPFLLHFVSESGGQPATPRQLLYVFEEGKRLFPRAKWEVSARVRDIYETLTLGIILGFDVVRVGFEDFIRLPNGEIAKNNVQIVESIVRIARDLGRDIATVDEAKEILSLSR
jgi:3-keto-5-aminohexanoate cleavage enzyme